ncbi:MAG: hypothetical protein AAF401_15070 [Pseudomonadota bacterium]
MPPLLLDSITDAGPNAAGRVVVSGSHGGLYPAALASAAGVRAVIFNDAGRGKDDAGVAGVLALGCPAAAADCMTCRIGDAADMVANGVVSVVNEAAQALGLKAGASVAEADWALASGAPTLGGLATPNEARSEMVVDGQAVILLDSAALVGPEDEGAIIVTGSHGGLIGGDPSRALKARARFAVFNDAGVGKDRVGLGRLPALDQIGVAAVTVDCMSARIGEARSAIETGVISAVNSSAERSGCAIGQFLGDAIGALPPR